MPDPPPAATPAVPAARPAPDPPPSEAAELELATLEATLPPQPLAGAAYAAERAGSRRPSTVAPAPGGEP